MKLQANALFITIVISMIIALMASMLILSAYYNKTSILLNFKKERLVSNANSGINLILGDEHAVGYDKPISIDIFQTGNDSVNLKKSVWGVFEIASATAYNHKDSSSQTVLYGYKPDTILKSAMYLSDQNRALFLCGTTKIKGGCYLPEAGVKRAYIEGQGYINSDLIDGTEKRSKTVLPKLDEKLSAYLAKQFLDTNAAVNTAEIPDTIHHSFSKPTLVIEIGSNHYTLNQKVFSGNIMIKSTGKLIISAQNKLNNIQVYATAIVVEENFKGSLQLFARDSLVIHKNCKLNYPSALGIVKDRFKLFQQFIKIEEGSVVEGICFGFCSVSDLNRIRITVDEKALVYGQLYSDGFAEIKGTVHGHVTCGHFRLRTPSSTYDNHLLNATIDFSKLSTKFVGSALLPSVKEKKVILNLE